jgi:hypothetical protein
LGRAWELRMTASVVSDSNLASRHDQLGWFYKVLL